MTKVIHVHLLASKKNYYFGSISAIYEVLDVEEVGFALETLRHSGLRDGVCLLSKKAMIIQSRLFRSGGDKTSIKGVGPGLHETRRKKRLVRNKQVR